MTEIDRLIALTDAFAMAGMRRTKGYSEIALGRLTVTRNGRRSFVRVSEINRYIAALETAEGKEQHQRAA
jgi:hypothetical protein